MSIAQWLDEQEAQGMDLSEIILPGALTYDEAPDEVVFFKELRPCSVLCTGNHPFSTVERFGHWYVCKGQDRKAGIHSAAPQWRLFTKDRELALSQAKAHLES